MTDLLNGAEFLTIIVGRKKKDEILKLLLESKCHLINVVYAKGSVKTGYFKDMLGLIPEEKKVMITCIIRGDLSNKLLEQLNTQYNFDKPNTGIAFIVSVDKLSV